MKKSVAFSVLLFLAPAFIGIAWANDDVIVDPEAAVPFVTMPAVANFPEGITANPANGDIYVSTFEFDTSGTETNTIVRFDANGTLLGQVDAIGNIPLLGLAFNSRDNKVYFASVGNFQFMASMIRRVNANFNGMPATANLSADGFTFGVAGTLPVSDKISLTGRLGMFFWDGDAEINDVSQATPEDSNLYFGAGAEYALTERFSFTGDWSRYDLEDAQSNVFSVGVQFSFGR